MPFISEQRWRYIQWWSDRLIRCFKNRFKQVSKDFCCQSSLLYSSWDEMRLKSTRGNRAKSLMFERSAICRGNQYIWCLFTIFSIAKYQCCSYDNKFIDFCSNNRVLSRNFLKLKSNKPMAPFFSPADLATLKLTWIPSGILRAFLLLDKNISFRWASSDKTRSRSLVHF